MSVIAKGNPASIANEVSKIIGNNIVGNIHQHFDTHTIENGFLVEALSQSGVFHNCWIKVYITKADEDHSIINFRSCDCGGIWELRRKISQKLGV